MRSRAVDFGIEPPLFDRRDIHVHVPEGATPKDGPSAGVGMATVIVSVLTGIPVRRDIAMTGEITLRGRVLPIGGLKEKLLAALRGGIKKVLIPEDNAKDLAEIPNSVKNGLEIVPVSRMDEVLRTRSSASRLRSCGRRRSQRRGRRAARRKRMARGSSRTDDPSLPRLRTGCLRRAEVPEDRRKFFGIRGLFSPRSSFRRQKRSFFARRPGKRLRSWGETASYGSNSAVDSLGAAMALGGTSTSARWRESPCHRRRWRRRTIRTGADNRAPHSNGEAIMNKLELVDHIATEAELTKVAAAAALEAVLEGIEKTLKKGEEVRSVGFGTFSVRERAAGKGRNPATGKEIKIAASRNARFKPGAALKASLNKNRPRNNSIPRVLDPSGGKSRGSTGAAPSPAYALDDRRPLTLGEPAASL